MTHELKPQSLAARSQQLADLVTHCQITAMNGVQLGPDTGMTQLRSVLRQLIALGALSVDEFSTLQLTEASRAVLKGEVPIQLRFSVAEPADKRARNAAPHKTHPELDAPAQQRLAALKAWRAEVAREHNLPAYVIFHDATLAAIASQAPTSLDALQGISGIGLKKLEAYGQDVLRVVGLKALDDAPLDA